jgi:hypothetical protein
MLTVKDEIRAASELLNLSDNEFRELPCDEALSLIQKVLGHFVGNDRRCWWEDFVGESASIRTPEDWKVLTQVAPDADEPAWFIAEGLAFEASARTTQQSLGECYGFEYYLVAKDLQWLICENHHDYLIGVGSEVIARIRALPLE